MAEATTAPAPNRPMLSNDIMSRKPPYDQWLEIHRRSRSQGLLHRGRANRRSRPLAGARVQRRLPAARRLRGRDRGADHRDPARRDPARRCASRSTRSSTWSTAAAPTTVWADRVGQEQTFEWQKHSLFLLPRNFSHQFTNMQGNRAGAAAALQLPAQRPWPSRRIPTSSSTTPIAADGRLGARASSTPRRRSSCQRGENENAGRAYWNGNFFPDMRAWDRLVPFRGRGAGGHVVWIQYPTLDDY